MARIRITTTVLDETYTRLKDKVRWGDLVEIGVRAYDYAQEEGESYEKRIERLQGNVARLVARLERYETAKSEEEAKL